MCDILRLKCEANPDAAEFTDDDGVCSNAYHIYLA